MCSNRPSRTSACGALKGLIKQFRFAMAVHDIRYYLNGIPFVAESKHLLPCST